MRVPSIRHFREAVDAIPDPVASIMVKTMYLTASRVSEVTTKTAPWDLQHKKTRPYGQFMSCGVEKWRWREGGREKTEDVLVITGAVARRRAEKNPKEGEDNIVYKAIALPTHPYYEPWTIDLMRYVVKHHKKLSFDLTRQRVWQLVKENLSTLDPTIHTNNLRQYRLAHLRKYGFSPYDFLLYRGWTARTGFTRFGLPPEKRVHLRTAWQEYFPKLLKPLSDFLYS